jgi:hypothetical protein
MAQCGRGLLRQAEQATTEARRIPSGPAICTVGVGGDPGYQAQRRQFVLHAKALQGNPSATLQPNSSGALALHLPMSGGMADHNHRTLTAEPLPSPFARNARFRLTVCVKV